MTIGRPGMVEQARAVLDRDGAAPMRNGTAMRVAAFGDDRAVTGLVHERSGAAGRETMARVPDGRRVALAHASLLAQAGPAARRD